MPPAPPERPVMPTGCCKSAACAPGGVIAAPSGNHGLTVCCTSATLTLPLSMSFQPTATAPVSLSVAASGADTVAADGAIRTSGVFVLVPTRYPAAPGAESPHTESGVPL